MKKTTFLFAALCYIAVVFGQTTVLRVNPDATGETEDGLTWETAYKTITSARIEGAGGQTVPTDIVEIWVKAGIYTEASHYMQKNVNVYGGFAGTETERDQRDWITNITVLKPSTTGKQVIVYYSSNASTSKVAEWDGFTITGVSGATGSGGAVRLQRGNTLRNCIITENESTGSGTTNGIIYMYPGSTLENCTVSNNFLNVSSGGTGIITIAHWNAANPGSTTDPAKIINCMIVNNKNRGNAIVSVGSSSGDSYSAEIYNTVIANNTALGEIGSNGNGAIAIGSASKVNNSKIVNCTVVNNEGPSGNGCAGISLFSNTENSSNIVNSIIAGNRKADGTVSNLVVNDIYNVLVAHTAVEDSLHTGTDNIKLIQNQFVNPTSVVGQQISLPAYNWSLLESSVCVNAGNNTAAYGLVDLSGNERVQKGTIDLGAYESAYDIGTGLNKQSIHSSISYDTGSHSLLFSQRVTSVDIYSLGGISVYSASQADGKITLPFLNAGVYILRYKLDNQFLQQKIIVK